MKIWNKTEKICNKLYSNKPDKIFSEYFCQKYDQWFVVGLNNI